jgi:membrane protease subunit HflC
MPTKDKLYISVDLFARWKITDPLQYFLRLRDERSAQSRLDDILGSETRNAVAKHELIEIIRTTKGRTPLRDTLLTDQELAQDIGALVPITKGRALVEQEIFAGGAEKVRVFGIELLDIRFKRINYNESVRPKIYDRMISERRQIAERFLSEGNGEAARIRGNRVRDLNKIQSEAYRAVEEIRGGGCAMQWQRSPAADITDGAERSQAMSPPAIERRLLGARVAIMMWTAAAPSAKPRPGWPWRRR